jgi:hypothetical protein
VWVHYLADRPNDTDDCSIGGCEGVCWKGSNPSSLALFRLPARALYGAGTLEHPDKTFIGRIERGFTFLGCWITKQGATRVAPSA